MSTTTVTPVLRPRQTKMVELLERIAGRDDRPSKMAVITRDGRDRIPNQTRAADYQRIDDLILLGLVANEAERGFANAYRLVVTDAGLAEIEMAR